MLQEEHALAGDQLGAKDWNEFYKKHELEHTTVLACGHLIGRDCYKTILKNHAGRTKPDVLDPRNCFHCRADLRCAGCPLSALYDESFNPFIPGPTWPRNEPATSRWQPSYSFQELTLTAAETDRRAKRYCDACTSLHIFRKLVECTLACPQCPTCASSPCSCGPEEQERNKDKEQQPQQQLSRPDRDALAEKWLCRKVDQLSRLVYPSTVDIRNPHLAARRGDEIATRRARFVKEMLADPKFRELEQAMFRLQEAEKEEEDSSIPTIGGKFKALSERVFSLKGKQQQQQPPQPPQPQQTIVPGPDWAHWAFCLAVQCVEEYERKSSVLRLPLAWHRGLEGDEEDDQDDESFRRVPAGKKRRHMLNWDEETLMFVMAMGVDSPEKGLAKVNPRLFAGTQRELVDVMLASMDT
ncbi:uncharacterized protein PG986_004260 [Apiospora aurea]|uniref:Uncharacterized protein n=1 Tax=Apiospora aurea TaxID=335848 RepID=A0ABR1QM42_9PEZI